MKVNGACTKMAETYVFMPNVKISYTAFESFCVMLLCDVQSCT